jgi:hypothetical protein
VLAEVERDLEPLGASDAVCAGDLGGELEARPTGEAVLAGDDMEGRRRASAR